MRSLIPISRKRGNWPGHLSLNPSLAPGLRCGCDQPLWEGHLSPTQSGHVSIVMTPVGKHVATQALSPWSSCFLYLKGVAFRPPPQHTHNHLRALRWKDFGNYLFQLSCFQSRLG